LYTQVTEFVDPKDITERPQSGCYIQGLYLERSPLIIEYYYWVIPIGVSYVVFQFFEALLRSRQKNILAVFIVIDILIKTLINLIFTSMLTGIEEFLIS
jgi:hypothetical protein